MTYVNTYANQDVITGTASRAAAVRQSSLPITPGILRAVDDREVCKTTLRQLSSLAMRSFELPTVKRLCKVKSPLKSAVSLAYNNNNNNSNSQELDGSDIEGLIVSDNSAGKVLMLGSSSNVSRQLIDDISPHGVTTCGDNNVVAVHSNQWGSNVKIISIDTGHIVTSWGRDLESWMPRAVATTASGQLVVTNVHPDSPTRLALFTTDGRLVNQFGRAVGPGDMVFRSPLYVTVDVICGRVMATDSNTNCIKMFDVRGNFIREFGSKSKMRSTAASSETVVDCPLGLCCDRLGNIIVCDSGHSRLVMYSNDGQFLGTLLDLKVAEKSRQLDRSLMESLTHRTPATLTPVDVALMPSGDRFAVTVNETRGGLSTFRKIIVCGVTPEL